MTSRIYAKEGLAPARFTNPGSMKAESPTTGSVKAQPANSGSARQARPPAGIRDRAVYDKLLFMFVCTMALLPSCTEFPDPAAGKIESYSFTLAGRNQVAYTGDYLDDSIGVRIINELSNKPVAGMWVELEVTQGGGSTDLATGYTDGRGRFNTRWKLGEESNAQMIQAFVYDSSTGVLRNTLTTSATGFAKSGWSTVSGIDNLYFSGMITDLDSGVTYARKYSSYLEQGERYYEWITTHEITVPYGSLVRATGGPYYAATGSGDIYKGLSFTGSWTQCTRPYNAGPSFFRFRITSDNTLWTTANGQPLKSSRDGGQTWVVDSAGIPSDETMIDLCRTSDGHFFYLSSSCRLYKSTDDGHHWTNVPVPYYPLKLYLTPNEELLLFNQNYGMSLYLSDDQGDTWTLIKSVNARFHTAPMPQCVFRHAEGYYVFIPGYGILNTTDFKQYTLFWMNRDAYRMYVTAGGDIYVTELDSQEVNIYHQQP